MAAAGEGEVNPSLEYDAKPTASGVSTARDSMARLDQILRRFEITIAQANDLVILQDYRLAVIADDSGSMMSQAAPPHMRTLGAPGETRWEELKRTLSEIVEIATCLDPYGIDIHFLNRPTVSSVKDPRDPRFVGAFQMAPNGSTPLTETLVRIAKLHSSSERPLLLFILTDGEPNGGKDTFIRTLKGLVTKQDGAKLRVQIMACTADEDEIGWLDQLDRELKEVDVTDDYYSEKEQVLRSGIVQKFTRGDWVMKAMLGPVSQKFDEWDERDTNKSLSGTCQCSVQ